MRRPSSFFVCFVSLFAAFGALVLLAGVAHSATYSQTVDNASKSRFAAPGWKVSDYTQQRFGKDYRYTEPSNRGKPAVYKFDIPKKEKYTVFMMWPANSGYNGSVKVGISAKSGMVWKTVNQRKNGGRWMNLGHYKFQRADKPIVRISQTSGSKGYIIADAVKIVAGKVGSPNTGGGNTGGGNNGGGNENGGGGGSRTGAAVVKEAKTWLGVPYKYGGTSRNGVDCSGLTYSVFRKLGVTLPRTAADQYNGGPGRQVAKNDFRRGYLIFGHADGGRGIEHVGILTGDGRMIHSPQPGTVVRYDSVPASWYNVVGIKKIFPA